MLKRYSGRNSRSIICEMVEWYTVSIYIYYILFNYDTQCILVIKVFILSFIYYFYFTDYCILLGCLFIIFYKQEEVICCSKDSLFHN